MGLYPPIVNVAAVSPNVLDDHAGMLDSACPDHLNMNDSASPCGSTLLPMAHNSGKPAIVVAPLRKSKPSKMRPTKALTVR
jgi:hypothetical protein